MVFSTGLPCFSSLEMDPCFLVFSPSIFVSQTSITVSRVWHVHKFDFSRGLSNDFSRGLSCRTKCRAAHTVFKTKDKKFKTIVYKQG